MITDSHCHLASNRFAAEEIPQLISRAREAGVNRLVSLSTDEEDLAHQVTLAHEHPEVWACVGIHPCSVVNASDTAIGRIAQLLPDPNIVAIGETGLDYFHPAPPGWTQENYRTRQLDFLEQHFALAATEQLGIVIHTRDLHGSQSFDDALALYQRYAGRVRALFHCFIGNSEQAARVIELDGLLGFGGVITFNSAKTLLDVASRLPAGTFVVETDSPYLAPTPHRGKRNEPALLRHTAECLASARGESWQELAAHTSLTAERFFHFDS